MWNAGCDYRQGGDDESMERKDGKRFEDGGRWHHARDGKIDCYQCVAVRYMQSVCASSWQAVLFRGRWENEHHGDGSEETRTSGE